MSDRIAHPGLRGKIMSAEEAAAFINHGDLVGFAGFTGAGYPKVVPPRPWPSASRPPMPEATSSRSR